MAADNTSHPPLPASLPVRYVDDRRYFEGYALPAMNADQIAATHRRIVADTNGEYRHRLFGSAQAKLAVTAGIFCNASLVAVEIFRLALGKP